MPHRRPRSLSESEHKAILRAAVGNLRDHLVYSLALGTGLRLAEIDGLNVGDVFALDGMSRYGVTILPTVNLASRYHPGHAVPARGPDYFR